MNGHMTDQQQQQQAAIGSAQSRPVPPGFQAPMFGQVTAGGGMDPSQQQHQMHSMLQHPASQQQHQGSFDSSGGHMGQQQYGASGQLGEAGGAGAGGFPPMFQPGFQTNMRPHPHTLFNRWVLLFEHWERWIMLLLCINKDCVLSRLRVLSVFFHWVESLHRGTFLVRQ